MAPDAYSTLQLLTALFWPRNQIAEVVRTMLATWTQVRNVADFFAREDDDEEFDRTSLAAFMEKTGLLQIEIRQAVAGCKNVPFGVKWELVFDCLDSNDTNFSDFSSRLFADADRRGEENKVELAMEFFMSETTEAHICLLS